MRKNQFVILDQKSKHAIVKSAAAFYAPIYYGKGLRFTDGTDVELMKHVSNLYAVDETSGLFLGSGWLPPRIPLYLSIRKTGQRRERINFYKSPDGTVTALNGFADTIELLFYTDENGRTYKAEKIAPGTRLTMRQCSFNKQKNLIQRINQITLEQIAGQADIPLKDSYIGELKHALIPSSYIALINSAPFLDNSISGAKIKKTRTFIAGINAETVKR